MCRFLAYGDHDAAIAWFRYAIRGRYNQVELAAACNRDRVGLNTVADKPIAERCRRGPATASGGQGSAPHIDEHRAAEWSSRIRTRPGRSGYRGQSKILCCR